MARPKKEIFCHECKKKIEEGEEYEKVQKKEEDGTKKRDYWEGIIYCLPCHEIKKQEEKEDKEKAEEKWKQEALDKFEVFDNECMGEVLFIGINLENNVCEISDYKKLKNLQKKLNSWPNRWKDDYIEGRKKDLKTSLEELENKVPERIKLKSDGKKRKRCSHKNIYWKQNETAYCLDCSEDENQKFLNKFQLKLYLDINNDCKKHNILATFDLKTTKSLWKSLGETKFTNQEEIISAYQAINQEYGELVKKKTGKEENLSNISNEKDNDIIERERERERESKIILQIELRG